MLDALKCQECGATRGMKLCHELFDDLLGIKYVGNGAAYRLALACYTFQHPKSHTKLSWWFARRYLEAIVLHDIEPHKAKEFAQGVYDQEEDALPEVPIKELPPLPWERTIAEFTGHQFLVDPLDEAIAWAHSLIHTYQEWETR